MKKELMNIKWELFEMFKYCDDLEEKGDNELARKLENDINKLITEINKLQEKGE